MQSGPIQTGGVEPYKESVVQDVGGGDSALLLRAEPLPVHHVLHAAPGVQQVLDTLVSHLHPGPEVVCLPGPHQPEDQESLARGERHGRKVSYGIEEGAGGCGDRVDLSENLEEAYKCVLSFRLGRQSSLLVVGGITAMMSARCFCR